MNSECKIYEDIHGDIVCELPCGYKARFFIKDLSDEEYIKRTKKMKEMDNMVDRLNG